MKNESYTMTYIGVHALIRNRKGQVLIIQRSEVNRYKPLMWDVPGGKMQTGESVEDAIKREVFEETGLTITVVEKPLSVYANTTQIPLREDLQIVFQCIAEDTEIPIRLEHAEHIDYKWVDIDELPQYELMAYLEYCRATVLIHEDKASHL